MIIMTINNGSRSEIDATLELYVGVVIAAIEVLTGSMSAAPTTISNIAINRLVIIACVNYNFILVIGQTVSHSPRESPRTVVRHLAVFRT
jgi:hypothetical protein